MNKKLFLNKLMKLVNYIYKTLLTISKNKQK